MSVIITKTVSNTIIVTENKRYIINQTLGKGIELTIDSIHPKRDDIIIRIWLPEGINTPTEKIENDSEMAIYPIPFKVLEDIKERIKEDIKIDDMYDYYGTGNPGEEFLMRIRGYILMSTK